MFKFLVHPGSRQGCTRNIERVLIKLVCMGEGGLLLSPIHSNQFLRLGFRHDPDLKVVLDSYYGLQVETVILIGGR